MIPTLLGGLSAQQFLSKYWQKKPLLIRNAVPSFEGIVSPSEIKSLAGREDVESRLVWQKDGAWQMTRGPLRKRDLPRNGAWTTLVQGLNLVSEEADALLRHFSFIPYARLDDLMVSYATDGGGVGPHFDSYDVFLLQGLGKRRWQISAQRDLAVVESAPLKILKNFKASKEWVLEAGDMLYLPPRYAHHGVAIGECMTYSIGFRAPSAQELAAEFLTFMQDNLNLPDRYADPDLRVAHRPAEIQAAMVKQVFDILKKIRWDKQDVMRFLGRLLSEPKQHVFFDAPASPLSARSFRTQAKRRGVSLDLRTQMLYRQKSMFINGEEFPAPGLLQNDDVLCFRQLADRRSSKDLDSLSDCGWQALYEWYSVGFLTLNQLNPSRDA